MLAGPWGWGALLIAPSRDPHRPDCKASGLRRPRPRRCPVTAALPRVSQEPSAPALGRGSVMPAEDTRAGNLHGAFLFYPSYLKVERFRPLFSFCRTPASRGLGVPVPGAGGGRRAQAGVRWTTLVTAQPRPLCPVGSVSPPVAGQAWVVWGVCVGSRRKGVGGPAVNTRSLAKTELSLCCGAREPPSPSPVPGPPTPQPGRPVWKGSGFRTHACEVLLA